VQKKYKRLNKKIMYYFAIFLIVIEILIKRLTNKRKRERERTYFFIAIGK